jgi:hypothetical protein
VEVVVIVVCVTEVLTGVTSHVGTGGYDTLPGSYDLLAVA